MLAHKVLVHQPAIDGLQLRIVPASNPHAIRHLFHHPPRYAPHRAHLFPGKKAR